MAVDDLAVRKGSRETREYERHFKIHKTIQRIYVTYIISEICSSYDGSFDSFSAGKDY